VKTELLSPAGSLKSLHYALLYGADAVYAGQPRYSLRVRNNDFHSLENLEQGISETHQQGKQFYLTVNIAPHNSKIKTFISDLTPILNLKPDALIISDPGLILLVREHFPDVILHLSVQANTVNYAAVKFWQTIGIKRIILSRELSLDEIEEIRQLCPDMELEVFVHGALCIAYSGRCLLSGYLNHRDPNQGTCTNACRWDYQSKPMQANDIWLVKEKQRDELMPMFEDEHGTYIFNSKDLRAVQHVQKLVKMGVDSLKIEGRTKSHYYVARTAQIYRRAIDDALQGKIFDKHLLAELDKLASRGYTEGFFDRHAPQYHQNYETGISVGLQQQFVGDIIGFDSEKQLIEIDVKNHFEIGDELEILIPSGTQVFKLEKMEDFEGNHMDVAKGSGYRVKISAPILKESVGGFLLKTLS
jgi:U32 family peptidase